MGTKKRSHTEKQKAALWWKWSAQALAACAEMRGAVWGELLYTADSLANIGASMSGTGKRFCGISVGTLHGRSV